LHLAFLDPRGRMHKNEGFSLSVENSPKSALALAISVPVVHIDDVEIARDHEVAYITSLLCFVYKIDTIDVDGKPEVQFKRLKRLVGERGFEPPTPWSRKQNTNVDSASLNYQINCENWMRLAPKFSPKSDRGLTSVLYYEHRYARYILKTALEFCFVSKSREVNDAEPLLTLALIEAGSANPRS
jgi:hypothetical protein